MLGRGAGTGGRTLSLGVETMRRMGARKGGTGSLVEEEARLAGSPEGVGDSDRSLPWSAILFSLSPPFSWVYICLCVCVSLCGRVPVEGTRKNMTILLIQQAQS